MNVILSMTNTFSPLAELSIPSLSLSLLCTSLTTLFLYWSNSTTTQKLIKSKEKVRSLKSKLKSLNEIIKGKELEISKLLLKSEPFDPSNSFYDKENMEYAPMSSHIPKINKCHSQNTKLLRLNGKEESKAEFCMKSHKMNAMFKPIQSVKGDFLDEEEVVTPRYEQDRINRFNQLLDDSEEWKIVKTFTKFNVEVRRSDKSKLGVPFTRMTCILEGIKPKDAYLMLSRDLCEQPSWNPHCESIDDFVTENGARIVRTRLILPLVSNREFIDRSASFHDAKNGIYYCFSEAASPSKYDYEEKFPLEKHVRGHVHFNGFSFEEFNHQNCTLLTQISQVDCKGSIPKFIVNKVGPNGFFDLVSNLDKAIRF